jgi:hypothetical protein
MTASLPGAPLEHTRPLLLGTGATTAKDASALYRRLEGATVAVSLDPQLPGALATTGIVLQTMRRLPSTLIFDPRGLTDATVAALVAGVDLVDPNRGMTVTSTDPPDPAIRVHVGIHPHGPAIRAVPEGYGGHLLTDPAVPVTPTRTANGLGQVFTASLATAEIFKTLAAVRPDRRRHHPHLRFCPVTLSRDLQAAPDLTGTGHLSLALLGVGAIGTALALILSLLPLAGDITVADRQPFSLENLGTYSLGGWTDATAAVPKTALAARALDRWDVRRIDGDVADLPALVDAGSLPWPEVVFTALDSPEARRHAQRLWPDILIDPGTSDTLLGMHDLRPAGPCVSCIYPPTTGGPSAAQRLAAATGLDPGYLAADGLLEKSVVDQLPPEQAERLRPLVGTPRCALAQAVGLTDLEAGGYRPSVPFVSQQAACLAVGRLVAHLTGASTTSNQIQLDALLGPGLLHLEEMAARPGCYCQLHQARIQTVRQLRRQGTTGPQVREA